MIKWTNDLRVVYKQIEWNVKNILLRTCINHQDRAAEHTTGRNDVSKFNRIRILLGTPRLRLHRVIIALYWTDFNPINRIMTPVWVLFVRIDQFAITARSSTYYKEHVCYQGRSQGPGGLGVKLLPVIFDFNTFLLRIRFQIC